MSIPEQFDGVEPAGQPENLGPDSPDDLVDPESDLVTNPFIFDNADPQLVQDYQDEMRNQSFVTGVGLFGQFLRKYVDGARDPKASEQDQRYFQNASNIIHGLEMKLREATRGDDEYLSEFRDNQETLEIEEDKTNTIDPKLLEVYHQTDDGENKPAVSNESLQAYGRREVVLKFYNDAKRNFFPELFVDEELSELEEPKID